MNKFSYLLVAASAMLLWSCSKDDDVLPDDVNPAKDKSLVVVNSGNFTYSNSSLTVWNEETGAYQDAFYKANDFKLGDVAQSATEFGGRLWVVVNNSNVIFAVDKNDFKEIGRIDNGLTSPRYIHFVSEDKAYVTQMYTDKIAIVNP